MSDTDNNCWCATDIRRCSRPNCPRAAKVAETERLERMFKDFLSEAKDSLPVPPSIEG
jgi:hypothetical protein